MNEQIIRDCWASILKLDRHEWQVPLQPLCHIRLYLEYFNLPLMPLDEKIASDSDITGIEPGFKNLTDEILLKLRSCIYSTAEMDSVSDWAEKLMRFCELRMGSIKKRAVEKCQSQASARLHLLHLAAFLLDDGVCVKDIRFINTALKLADIKWMLDPGQINKKLTGDREEFLTGLFQFRVLLVMEYTMDRLQEGKSL
jgi:hypothetical protein